MQQSLENTISHKGLLVSLKIFFNLPKQSNAIFREACLSTSVSWRMPMKVLVFLLSGFKEKIKSFSLTLTLATPYKVHGRFQDTRLAMFCVLQTVSFCMSVVFRSIFVMN